jgi:hypothetical protein
MTRRNVEAYPSEKAVPTFSLEMNWIMRFLSRGRGSA